MSNGPEKEDEELKKIIEMKKQEEQLKAMLRRCLQPEAYERIMVVKHANPELFAIASQQIISLSGRTGKQLSEEELKKILKLIKMSREKETRIEIRRK